MCKKITFLLILSLLIISCSEDNSSGPSNENGSGSQGSEIPCNTSNEGMVIKPADSETERICKDGVWEVVLNSSSSVQVVESSSSEIINIPVPVNSSANEIFSSSAEESSSSILISGETTESSSSETEIIEQSSSSSEEFIESSSSEETKLYLCEDGETYVLDPANCEKVSSSSVIVVSSSSDNKPISSSSDVQESSSSEMSSSSMKQESSSSKAESSSSINISSSSELENGSSSSEESSSSGFVGCIMGSLYDDRDGKTYKTVKIGEQEWMAENLNYDVQNYESSYRSWCYDGEVDNCQKYGRLYRWSVVIDSLTLANDSAITCGCRKSGEGICTIPYKWKGICPNGWHIPTQNEWGDLVNFVGGSDIAGKKLKSSEGWVSLGGINGTDEFCFAGSPAGYRSGSASYSNDYMYFWTADQYESGSTNAYAMYGFYKSNIFYSCYESTCVKAFPIRCIKD